MPTVLLEIGTEEMPAGYMPAVCAQLADAARARLVAERISFGELHSWGTNRRIVLYLTGVAENQQPSVSEVRGPSVQEAFVGHGEPTQAAIGFARSQGLAVNELRIKKIDGEEFVFAIFKDEGRPIIELLPEIFKDLITNLTFPKTMRWGDSDFQFARPIRWLAAMMDQTVLPVSVDGVTSGSTTRGHRFLAPQKLEISSAADYPRLMEENHVLVDQDIRREVVRQQLVAVARQENAMILDDGSLLEATVYGVEFPSAVLCKFDGKYLALLPGEALLNILKLEQCVFPLADSQGKLLPNFIAVRNGDKAYLNTVREGYEAALEAKILDALFLSNKADTNG